MNYSEFLEDLKRGPRPAYIFHGEEEHVKASMLERLKSAVLDEAFAELNCAVLTAPAMHEVVDTAEVMPLMGGKRLTIVKEFAPLEKPGKGKQEKGALESLIGFVKNPPEYMCLVFYVRGALEQSNSALKALSGAFAVVSFGLLSVNEAARWIRSQAKPRGFSIGQSAALLLADRAGRNINAISSELDKLAAYVGEGREITEAAIELLSPENIEFTVFQILDDISAGRARMAIDKLLRSYDFGQTTQSMLALIERGYRIGVFAAELINAGGTAGEAERALEVNGYAVKKGLEQVKRIGLRAAKASLKRCAELDYEIKSGALRDDKLALQALILDLCNKSN